ncbi:MAG: electron transfer flavoprotein subunit beta/FixA family protein [Dehalococcoidia bacterium]
MNIIVCVKQVPDPETPASQFRVDEAAKKVIPPSGIEPTVNQYDANAIEAAVQLKEQNGGRVTVLSLGKDKARDAVKQALSMGCDAGVLIDDPAFEDADAFTTATALAAAIRGIGDFDLILCGRQASDWDQAQVPQGLAELLGVPSVTPVAGIEVAGNGLRVKRLIEDGYEVLDVPTPALLAVSNEANQPRYPTLKGIMAAARAKVEVKSGADLGVSAAGRKVQLLRLYVPKVESQIEMIPGETPEEQAANLARRLREERVI